MGFVTLFDSLFLATGTHAKAFSRCFNILKSYSSFQWTVDGKPVRKGETPLETSVV